MAGVNPVLVFTTLNIIFLTCVSAHHAPCPPNPTPSAHSATPTKATKCPKDTLKFGVCGDWLGIVHEVVGTKPSPKCCALVEGLADLEAALCLCTAIKANVVGIVKVEIPIALSLVINSCGKRCHKALFALEDLFVFTC